MNMHTQNTNRRKILSARAAGFIVIGFICLPLIAQAGSWGRVFAFLDRPVRAQREEQVRAQEERREQQEQRTQEEAAIQRSENAETNNTIDTATPDAADVNSNEETTVEQIETNAVNLTSPQTHGLEQLRARTVELVRSMIARITDAKTRIASQGSGVGSEDLTTEALTNLQSDIDYFTQEQSTIETAENTAAIRNSIVEVREHVRERKTRMAGVRSRAQEKAKTRIDRAVVTGEQIVEKLRTVENKLKKQGLNTAPLTALINEQETTVQNLRTVDIETERDALKEQIALLRTQMQTIVDTIQSLIQSARAK